MTASQVLMSDFWMNLKPNLLRSSFCRTWYCFLTDWFRMTLGSSPASRNASRKTDSLRWRVSFSTSSPALVPLVLWVGSASWGLTTDSVSRSLESFGLVAVSSIPLLSRTPWRLLLRVRNCACLPDASSLDIGPASLRSSPCFFPFLLLPFSASAALFVAVSYTHLTLPKTPYV